MGALAAVAALALPAPARAVSWLDLARPIAIAYWGQEPCGGHVTIATGDLGADNAIATWTTSSDGTHRHCRVTYNSRLTANTGLVWSWPRFCTVTVHEFGHLTGHSHAATGVMTAIYAGPIPECMEAPGS